MVKFGWKGKLRMLHPRHAGVVASFALKSPGNPEPSPSILSHGLCHGNTSP